MYRLQLLKGSSIICINVWCNRNYSFALCSMQWKHYCWDWFSWSTTVYLRWWSIQGCLLIWYSLRNLRWRFSFSVLRTWNKMMNLHCQITLFCTSHVSLCYIIFPSKLTYGVHALFMQRLPSSPEKRTNGIQNLLQVVLPTQSLSFPVHLVMELHSKRDGIFRTISFAPYLLSNPFVVDSQLFLCFD